MVSDNYSQDETREVVSACRDRRVKYINTGRRISMSHNWEFALSHINDGYVIYLGDDDALIPQAIKSLARLIAETGSKAICWNQASYTWPYGSQHYANVLSMPMRNSLVSCQADKMLKLAIEFKIGYTKLPWLYKGIVSHEAIQRAKSSSGRFFNSMTPDVYSGIAIAAVIKEYLFSERPYTINGASRHSTGMSNFSGNANSAPKELFLAEDNIPFHDRLVFAPSKPILVAESFLQLKDHCRNNGSLPEINYEQLIIETMKGAVSAPPGVYDAIVSAVIGIGDRNELSDFARNVIAKYKNAHSAYQHTNYGYNFMSQTLIIDCEPLGIRDVYEASRLCFYILKIQNDYLSFKGSLTRMLERALRKISREIRRRFF